MTNNKTTLTVRTRGGNDSEEFRDRVRALERGEQVEDQHLLVLAETDLHRLLSPTNLALLRTIREHDPDSMRETAALVDRDFKDVHRNLTELEALNVIEFEDDGRSKRPVVRFDEIDVEVSLRGSDSDVAPV